VKVSYRQAASDDLVHQFRYYLVTLNLPKVAVRFRDAVRCTMQAVREQPRAGALYRLRNPQLQDLRSWPVTGFEMIRIYYRLGADAIHVVRMLHGKQEVRRILEHERPAGD
jgi:plasmid stabilization system protein ParE